MGKVGEKEHDMADFTIIETQEQFDEAVTARLKREQETLAKKYEGYISPEDFQAKQDEFGKKINELAETSKTLEAQISEKDEKIKGFEKKSLKTKIAQQAGLPSEAIEILTGEDEETLKQSAETIKKLMGTSMAPAANKEPKEVEDEALRATLRNLKGE